MIPCVSVTSESRGKSRMAANLEIYGIQGRSSSPRPAHCSLLATLQLPPFSRKVTRMQIKCQSTPGPCLRENHGTTASYQKPFYPDPLRRIFAISLDVFVGGKSRIDQAIKAFTIFVHSDALLNLLGKDVLKTGRLLPGSVPKIFPWGSWSRYARVTTMKPPNPFSTWHPQQTYGEKFIEHKRDTDCSRLHVWDFNLYSVWRRDEAKRPTRSERIRRILSGANYDVRQDASSSSSTDVVHVTGPTVLKDSDVFQHSEVSSGLPYRRVAYPRTFPSLSDVM